MLEQNEGGITPNGSDVFRKFPRGTPAHACWMKVRGWWGGPIINFGIADGVHAALVYIEVKSAGDPICKNCPMRDACPEGQAANFQVTEKCGKPVDSRIAITTVRRGILEKHPL